MIPERTIHWREDKVAWGEGPWIEEPDKIQWTDDETGYPCLIVRNRGGALCGYVGVDEQHPYFGQDYNNVMYLDVHGGLTFSDVCAEGPEAEDRGICHVPQPGKPDRVWWFGFDTAHLGDYAPGYDHEIKSYIGRSYRLTGFGPRPQNYKTVAYVEAEVTKLASQLEDARFDPKIEGASNE